jgi:hypothetical protein
LKLVAGTRLLRWFNGGSDNTALLPSLLLPLKIRSVRICVRSCFWTPRSSAQQLLNSSGSQRYAFHWYEGVTPPNLLLYQQHQQDALLHGCDGLVAGTDGSVDKRVEWMGTGYVVGADPIPILTFFARVGGPLATTRA